MHYILKSNFARIFLFFEAMLKQETQIKINCLCYSCLHLTITISVLIVIGYSKQCIKSL